MGQRCGAELWGRAVGQHCGAALWGSVMEQRYGAELWGSSVGQMTALPTPTFGVSFGGGCWFLGGGLRSPMGAGGDGATHRDAEMELHLGGEGGAQGHLDPPQRDSGTPPR